MQSREKAEERERECQGEFEQECESHHCIALVSFSVVIWFTFVHQFVVITVRPFKSSRRQTWNKITIEIEWKGAHVVHVGYPVQYDMLLGKKRRRNGWIKSSEKWWGGGGRRFERWMRCLRELGNTAESRVSRSSAARCLLEPLTDWLRSTTTTTTTTITWCMQL